MEGWVRAGGQLAATRLSLNLAHSNHESCEEGGFTTAEGPSPPNFPVPDLDKQWATFTKYCASNVTSEQRQLGSRLAFYTSGISRVSHHSCRR